MSGELVSLSDDEESDEGGSDDEEEDTSGEDSSEDEAGDDASEEEATIDSSKINLDITAMIAYVSALTNGRNWFTFKEKILAQQVRKGNRNEKLRSMPISIANTILDVNIDYHLDVNMDCQQYFQAQWERERPVKPFLDSVFRDKQLVCCQSAMTDFQVTLTHADSLTL